MLKIDVRHYHNGSELEYKSVKISGHSSDKTFSTGNFIKDWYAAMKHVVTVVASTDDEFDIIESPSVNAFLLAGAPYRPSWLVATDDGKAHLSYTFEPECLKLFVNDGASPTWEEFQALYGKTRG
jgi:hypothetical protein